MKTIPLKYCNPIPTKVVYTHQTFVWSTKDKCLNPSSKHSIDVYLSFWITMIDDIKESMTCYGIFQLTSKSRVSLLERTIAILNLIIRLYGGVGFKWWDWCHVTVLAGFSSYFKASRQLIEQSSFLQHIEIAKESGDNVPAMWRWSWW